MEERTNQLMNFILNDQKHLKRYLESPSVFKQQKKSQLKQEINANSKPILKGSFFSYSKLLKQFKMFYFELYTNILIKYQDKTKAPPVEHVYLQNCIIGEENEIIGDSVAYGITLVNEDEIAKLVIDKLNTHMVWKKSLMKFCRLTDFVNRYKIETRMYDHFYRCVDMKKKAYTVVKIINKKGLKQEYKHFVSQEIHIYRKVNSPLLPRLKKVYEDEGFIYMNFEYFQGEDLLKIVKVSKLEEIAIATLTHHVLKGLKSLHLQNVFHGNLKLENIVFGSTQRDENEIFLINLKYSEEISEFYRDRLIKKGLNQYVAPEVLDGGQVGPQIDMFALGVCIYYMAFYKYPYLRIEQASEGASNQPNAVAHYKYELDFKMLEGLQKEKKLNPSKIPSHVLSASGVDFLMKLLEVNPEKRLSSTQALMHHWFINFTTKPQDSKQIQEYRQSKKMQSLNTILECSEISERDLDHTRLSKLRGLTFQSIPTQNTARTQTMVSENLNKSMNNHASIQNTSVHHIQQQHSNISDMFTSNLGGEIVSEEGSVLMNLMGNLQTNLPVPKLMNRDRAASSSETTQNSHKRKQSDSLFPLSTDPQETES